MLQVSVEAPYVFSTNLIQFWLMIPLKNPMFFHPSLDIYMYHHGRGFKLRWTWWTLGFVAFWLHLFFYGSHQPILTTIADLLCSLRFFFFQKPVFRLNLKLWNPNLLEALCFTTLHPTNVWDLWWCSFFFVFVFPFFGLWMNYGAAQLMFLSCFRS